MDVFANIQQVSFSYRHGHHEPLLALNGVSMTVERGRHIAVLGRNGSGKSTLARLINALELPSEGVVLITGKSTADHDNVWEIRRLCGMVFQNPDNQIVGTTVEEDVAFGPENLGFKQADIRRAVDDALTTVGLSDQAEKAPHLLSGGQKQKLAIAGILAMQPQCLILDEATSMLDPKSRQEFMSLVSQLVEHNGLTVINITHNMEEALLADSLAVMSEGRLVAQGLPAKVFEQVGLIKDEGLDVPVHNEIAHLLSSRLELELKPGDTSTWDKAVTAVGRMLSQTSSTQAGRETLRELAETASCQETSQGGAEREKVITVQNLSYTYSPGTLIATSALSDVSFDVYKGELLGIIGHSGSGKSTLIQHLNGLLRLQSGQIEVLGMDASGNNAIRKIRQKVGLLFQYPEHQLFEETVYRDIAFGPRRMGLGDNEIDQRVRHAAQIVGIKDSELSRSPFELSGGQKRRAAIAGILAMEPEVLILDEPAAGLDPAGRDEILGYARTLRDLGVTVILVSHSMEDVSRLADRVLVLRQGRVHAVGSPAEVFADDLKLSEAGLEVPRPSAFLRRLKPDYPDLDTNRYSPSRAVDALIVAAAAKEGGVA